MGVRPWGRLRPLLIGLTLLGCAPPAERRVLTIDRAPVEGVASAVGGGPFDALDAVTPADLVSDEDGEDGEDVGRDLDSIILGDESLDTRDIGLGDVLDEVDTFEHLDGGDMDGVELDAQADLREEVAEATCPPEMVRVLDICMDRYEAPNLEGEPPFVMFNFYEAERWCQARDKRLCFDDEWTTACAGEAGLAYPYGDVRVAGRCNDAKTWRAYNQALLNGWPNGLTVETIVTLDDLLSAVRARGANASAAADHVMALYQAGVPGDYPGCVGEAGVYDLVGSIEEWTRRRDGGAGPDFSGALKGRYWAESRTCQSRVLTHGNAFRFYEIGFRCCRDVAPR